MDGKKKLMDAYNPERAARKERIVVGLSGGFDSAVAAYLLKIQKYEVFGVTVAVGWDQFKGDKSATLSCHISEQRLDTIAAFCQQLNIPHYVVKATSEFQEDVVEAWMSARVTGRHSNACWNCHELRMNILYQKMKELEAMHLATGHYAKIFHHEGHDTYYVHSSNDEENDQSGVLSHLPLDLLKHLILPLSDLQKKEVLKLAENFGLGAVEKKLKMHECFPQTDSTTEFLTERVPAKFIVPGEMVSADGTEGLGDHEGIIKLTYGKEIEVPMLGRKDKVALSGYSFKEKKAFMSRPEDFMHEHILLVNCNLAQETPWSEPLKGSIRLSQGEFLDCWIYPKSLHSAYVQWEGEAFVREGEVLCVYRKKGKNAKLFFTGKSQYVEKINDEVEDEGDKKSVKVDFLRDF